LIDVFKFKFFSRPESLACYHCGEQVSVRDVVKHTFHGQSRDLCCHGCEAVLMMVESNGLTDTYLRDKASAAILNHQGAT